MSYLLTDTKPLRMKMCFHFTFLLPRNNAMLFYMETIILPLLFQRDSPQHDSSPCTKQRTVIWRGLS